MEKMKILLSVLAICLIGMCLGQPTQAVEILDPMPVKDVFDSIKKGIAPTPAKIYKALEYTSKILSYETIKDPVLKDVLKGKETIQFGTGMAMGIYINTMVEAMDEKGVFKGEVSKDSVRLWSHMAKNALMGDVKGAVIDAGSMTLESWRETRKVIASLPEEAVTDTNLRDVYKLTKLQEQVMRSSAGNIIEKTIGKAVAWAELEAARFILATAEGNRMWIERGFQKAIDSSDASKVKEGTPQQLVTPVKVEFTQTFDGLFTQSAAGIHSGTLTDGTRVNVKNDSRPGDFTGSFSGQTVAETGYTPATHNNSAFSGSSVGTASAKGFKEGDLKGTMTVTVPAGTQTATVSGNITIKTDGSLSMPSYSGPVTVNATGAKVGAMSGSWSQSKTR